MIAFIYHGTNSCLEVDEKFDESQDSKLWLLYNDIHESRWPDLMVPDRSIECMMMVVVGKAQAQQHSFATLSETSLVALVAPNRKRLRYADMHPYEFHTSNLISHLLTICCIPSSLLWEVWKDQAGGHGKKPSFACSHYVLCPSSLPETSYCN